MRSSLASLMTDGFAASNSSGANRGDVAGRMLAADFRSEIATASQVFADGLAEMWATRAGTGASDRKALIASITPRADGLAARAPDLIRDLAARRIRAADALTPPFPGPRGRRADMTASAS